MGFSFKAFQMMAGIVRPDRGKGLQRIFLVCGILSSALYLTLNIAVPFLYKGYDSISQTISELSAVDAPTRPLWIPFGILYSLLIMFFGLGVWKAARQNRPLRIAGGLLFLYGIIGQGWTFAPMHQRAVLAAGGETISDTFHVLIMAPLSALFMVLAMGFAAVAINKPFRNYSIFTILTLLLFGILTGIGAPKVEHNLPTPWLGVFERVMLGAFLLWVVVLAVILLRKQQNPFNENLR
jgi:Protein of unknown function (DUF998)